MFGNANVNTATRTQNSINSKIRVIMTDDARLTLGLWNSSLTLTLNPASSKDAETGLVQYDNMKAVKAFVNVSNAETILKALDDILMPEFNKGIKGEPFGETSVSVKCGSSKKMMVTFELMNIDNAPVVKLGLYGPVTEQNTADINTSGEIVFQSDEILEKYSPMTGSSEKTIKCQSDFLLIYRALQNLIGITGITAHGIKYDKSFSRFSDNTSGYGSNSSERHQPASTSSWMSTTGQDELPF